MSHSINRFVWLSGSIFAIAILGAAIAPPVRSQITAEPTGTNTNVTLDGNQFEITGGALSSNGANWFHSFTQFNLDAKQIANFLANPQIQNILARVVTNDPSVINGLIQVTDSNANFYLMNPNGIIFGPGASLDVGGDFFAVTATGIGFSNGWFNAFGDNNYDALNGNPDRFAFDLAQAGAIVNEGELIVNRGKDIALIGGTIVNAGTVTTTGGEIEIRPVPGENLVRISRPNGLLNLEVELQRDANGLILPFTPLDLPKLLTTPGVSTNLTVNPDNTVQTESGASLPVKDAFSSGLGRSTRRPTTVVALENAVFTLPQPQSDPVSDLPQNDTTLETNPQTQPHSAPTPNLVVALENAMFPLSQPQSDPVSDLPPQTDRALGLNRQTQLDSTQITNTVPFNLTPNLNRTTDSTSQSLCPQVNQQQRDRETHLDVEEHHSCRFLEEEAVPILDTSEVPSPESAR